MVRPTKPRPIELMHEGPFIRITPAPADLPELLKNSDIRLVRRDVNGTVTDWADWKYYYFEPLPGSACCHRGLKPLATEWLERNGYQYSERGDRVSVLGEPDRKRLAEIRICDESFLEFLRCNERGVIRFEAGKVAPGRLILQAALAFPDKKIAVCVERVAEIEKIESYLPGHVSFSIHTCRQLGQLKRVALTTIGNASGGWLGEYDIVFLLDPRRVSGSHYRFWGAVGECGRARLFALVPGSTIRTRDDDSRMIRVFGFEELFIARPGYRSRDISVAMLPIDGGPKLSRSCQLEDLKRDGLWRQPIRNRRIAKLAKLLAAGDEAEIRAAFPQLPPRILRLPKKRIVIAVENVEHALKLAELLPDWDIVAGDNCFLGDLTPGQIKSGSSD